MHGEELQQTLYQGATHHQAGRLPEAEQIYRRVLATAATNPEANHNLGVLAMQTGKGLAIALPFFKTAWQSDPRHHQHWLSYLRALVQSGDQSTAQQVYADGRERGLEGPDPNMLRARSTTGRKANPPARAPKTKADLSQEYAKLLQYIGQSDFATAERHARALCAQYPQQATGWKGLGLSLQAQGRDQDAIAALKRAAQHASDDTQIWYELGQLLYRGSLFTDAEVALRRALAIDENYPGALHALAQILMKLYRPVDSEAACRKALSGKPDAPDLLLCLAEALQAQGRAKEAILGYQQVLDVEPRNIEAYRALGSMLFEREDDAELVILCRQMIAAAPDYFFAHRDFGTVLLRAGRLDEAADAFRQGLKLRPEDLQTRCSWLFCCNYLSTMPGPAIYEEAITFGKYAAAQAQPFQTWSYPRAPERLRVGLVSGDLCAHPVGYFLENVLAHTDTSRIEWIAYATSTAMDSVSLRLQEQVDHWTILAGKSIEACAQQIHADGVHILLDLSGHSEHNILPAFSWRPAPVQASWLGYFATTGLTEMDYFLADEVSVPAEEHSHFSESIWTLPNTRLCFTPPEDAPEVSISPAVSRGYVTFGSFQKLSKITDEVLARWAQILEQCVDARLRIQSRGLDVGASRQAFIDRAEDQGIAPSQLDLFGAESRSDYLARHAEVDILLDTFPFPGGTTTCEALWMGVPTITLSGTRLVSRQGASLLTAAGLNDWIAESGDAYIRLAIEKANNLHGLNVLRSQLRDQVSASPLFDSTLFAGNLADALWGMWDACQERIT